VKWERDGKEFEKNTVIDGKKLTIETFTEKNIGFYKCFNENKKYKTAKFLGNEYIINDKLPIHIKVHEIDVYHADLHCITSKFLKWLLNLLESRKLVKIITFYNEYK
jgi:hypothetical protein